MKTPWYKTALGSLLIQKEKKILDQILPNLYGYHLLQVAPGAFLECVQSSLILHRVNTHLDLKSEDEALPILSETIDVVVLMHTLEQKNLGLHPHQILREAYRVLIPGGHLVITGFNPFSFYGCKMRMKYPIKLVTRNTIKDWLSLLDLECINIPGLPSFSVSSFFEPIYHFVAVKRVIPLTIVKKPAWSKSKVDWAQEEGIINSGYKKN